MFSVIGIVVYLSYFTLLEECQCYSPETTDSSDSSLSSTSLSSSSSYSLSSSSSSFSLDDNFSSSSSSSKPASAPVKKYGTKQLSGIVKRDKAKRSEIYMNNERFNEEKAILDAVAGEMVSGLVELLMTKEVGTEELELKETVRTLKLKNAVVSSLERIYDLETNILGQGKSVIEFEIMLAFKKVTLQSDIDYTTGYLGLRKNLKGKVTLVFSHRFIMSVYGSVPINIHSRISALRLSQQCFITINTAKAYKISEGFSLIDINSGTQMKRLHKEFIKSLLLQKASVDIVPVVGNVLQKELEQAIRGLSIVCKD